MKKKDITDVFEGATDEQVTAILNLNNADIGKAKSAAEADRDKYKTDLDAANQKLSGFEGVDVDGMQGKVTAAEQMIADLQAQLAAEKVSAAVRLGLLEAKALDTDYLTYKLTEKLKADGKAVELDDSGKIKDWDNLLDSMKKQFPTQFAGGGSKRIEEHRLPEGDQGASAEPATLAEALQAKYENTD